MLIGYVRVSKSDGSRGLATAAERDEQRKAIKYNHLVTNLLIFHAVVGMTNALENLATGGHRVATSDEALADLSPYQTDHINRFGDYFLDLSTPPARCPSCSQPAASRHVSARKRHQRSLYEGLARIVSMAQVGMDRFRDAGRPRGFEPIRVRRP